MRNINIKIVLLGIFIVVLWAACFAFPLFILKPKTNSMQPNMEQRVERLEKKLSAWDAYWREYIDRCREAKQTRESEMELHEASCKDHH